MSLSTKLLAWRAERPCNLSRLPQLQEISFSLRGPSWADLSQIPSVLVSATSECLRSLAIAVAFKVHSERDANDLDRFLKTGKTSKALTQVDDVLRGQRFSSVVACGVILALEVGATVGQRTHRDAIKKRRERWLRLVRQKMPHSYSRGILLYVILVSVDVWSSFDLLHRVQVNTR